MSACTPQILRIGQVLSRSIEMALTHLRAWIPCTSPLKLSWQFFPSLPQTVDKYGVPSTYSNRRRHEEFSKEACLPANAALQSCGGPICMRSTRDLQVENGATKEHGRAGPPYMSIPTSSHWIINARPLRTVARPMQKTLEGLIFLDLLEPASGDEKKGP